MGRFFIFFSIFSKSSMNMNSFYNQLKTNVMKMKHVVSSILDKICSIQFCCSNPFYLLVSFVALLIIHIENTYFYEISSKEMHFYCFKVLKYFLKISYSLLQYSLPDLYHSFIYSCFCLFLL